MGRALQTNLCTLCLTLYSLFLIAAVWVEQDGVDSSVTVTASTSTTPINLQNGSHFAVGVAGLRLRKLQMLATDDNHGIGTLQDCVQNFADRYRFYTDFDDDWLEACKEACPGDANHKVCSNHVAAMNLNLSCIGRRRTLEDVKDAYGRLGPTTTLSHLRETQKTEVLNVMYRYCKFPPDIALMIAQFAFNDNVNVSHRWTTPLYIATMHRKRDVMRFLLDKGADPNRTHPLLIHVVGRQDTEALKMLLEHGAKFRNVEYRRTMAKLESYQDPEKQRLVLELFAEYDACLNPPLELFAEYDAWLNPAAQDHELPVQCLHSLSLFSTLPLLLIVAMLISFACTN